MSGRTKKEKQRNGQTIKISPLCIFYCFITKAIGQTSVGVVGRFVSESLSAVVKYGGAAFAKKFGVTE